MKGSIIRLVLTAIVFSFFKVAHAQKDEFAISAGPLVSFPIDESSYRFLKTKTGAGFEAMGQYNFSKRSTALLQFNLMVNGYKNSLTTDTTNLKHYRRVAYRLGYRYWLGTSRFFVNGLYGFEKFALSRNERNGSLALGAGKRFTINDIYFIETAIDATTTATDSRLNLKVSFGFLGKPNK